MASSIGDTEHKNQSDSKGKDQPNLKGMVKDGRTVDRGKVSLKVKGKVKAGKSKHLVPQRTNSLKTDEGLQIQGQVPSREEVHISCLPQKRVDDSSRPTDQNLDKEPKTQTDEFKINLDPKLAVAAIDFGTTYSGYAFAFTHDNFGDKANPDKIFVSNWENEGGSGMYAKTPTCLLLDPDGNLHSFGNAAMEKYSSLTDDNEHHDWYFFWQFKMVLHQDEVFCLMFCVHCYMIFVCLYSVSASSQIIIIYLH